MKICYIVRSIDVPYVSGICAGGSTHAYEVSRNLVKNGHTVYLFCSQGTGQKKREELDGVDINRLFKHDGKICIFFKKNAYIWKITRPFFYFFKYFKESILLTRALFCFKCDVIYERSSQATRIFSLFYRLLKIPLVLEVNDFYEPFSLRFAKSIVTPNKVVIPKCYHAKVKAMPWGVNIAIFKPLEGRGELRSRYGLENRKVVTLVCSGFIWHGIDDLISAAALVINKDKEIVFMIVGGGDYFSVFKDRVNSLGLIKNFIFTGPVDYLMVPELIALSDITVAPYSSLLKKLGKNRELYATPLKVLEYMACAKPAVITDVANKNGIIEHMVTGLVVKEDSPLELADAISYLAKDKQLRISMGRKAREVVENKFSWQLHVKELEKIFVNTAKLN
jgi:glycosyltransferase involved in cell wall biosynthesis